MKAYKKTISKTTSIYMIQMKNSWLSLSGNTASKDWPISLHELFQGADPDMHGYEECEITEALSVFHNQVARLFLNLVP